jgi:RND family efflux transporter MFP subunit
MKKLLIVLAVLAVGAGGWWWFHNRPLATKPAVPATPDTAPVKRRTINVVVEAIGEVQPANQVMVKSEVSGRIKTMNVITGQQVKRGAVLATLDDADLLTEKSAAETEIAGTQVRLDKAQRDYDRHRDLFREQLVSQEVFDNSKTALDTARNEFEKAQSRLRLVEDKLKKVQILAPFDGTVLNVLVSKGQVVSGATGVSQGTDLMAFADLNEMILRAHVNQVDAGKLQAEQAATITVSSVPDVVWDGRVILIAPQATVKSGIKGFLVDVLILKPDPRLRPGMNAALNFAVAHAADVLAVPLAAVFQERQEKVVYVAATNAPERRVVTTGVSDTRHCEIRTGLTEGETVLLERPANAPAPSRAGHGTD